MFEMKQYVSSKPWLQDDYLVVPAGVKKCRLCKRRRYTIEFADANKYFVDGKLPVCTDCLRSTKTRDLAKDLINQGGTEKCGRCKKVKPLGDFRVKFSENTIMGVCLACVSRDVRKRTRGK